MENFSFLPFKNLESERLFLRQITPDDVKEVFALRSNRDVMKYIPRPLCIIEEDAIALINMMLQRIETNEGINWAITLKNSDKLIGYIGHFRIEWENFRSEIGYMILPEYSGKGIATEAVKLLVAYGFDDMKMHSIEAIIDPENIPSAKVLEKNGFIKEGHFKENEYFEGKFIDSVVYSLLNK